MVKKFIRYVDMLNAQIAEIVSAATGNMWFFWLALFFILFLRISHPPSPSSLLLDIENDLQLLLLATAAVVGAKAMAYLVSIVTDVKDVYGRQQHLIEDQKVIMEAMRQTLKTQQDELMVLRSLVQQDLDASRKAAELAGEVLDREEGA